jgi:hypothetical protein
MYSATRGQDILPYKNSFISIGKADKRFAKRMTIEEKFCQLFMISRWKRVVCSVGFVQFDFE